MISVIKYLKQCPLNKFKMKYVDKIDLRISGELYVPYYVVLTMSRKIDVLINIIIVHGINLINQYGI